MKASVMNDKFHDWLDECPVQWYRINNGKLFDTNGSYHEGASYMFIKDNEENEEDEE